MNQALSTEPGRGHVEAARAHPLAMTGQVTADGVSRTARSGQDPYDAAEQRLQLFVFTQPAAVLVDHSVPSARTTPRGGRDA